MREIIKYTKWCPLCSFCTHFLWFLKTSKNFKDIKFLLLDILKYMGNRIHTIDFFSICEFVGELILSFDSTLFGWWVSSQIQVEVILYSSPTQFSWWGWIKKQTMDFCLNAVLFGWWVWVKIKFIDSHSNFCVVLLMGVNQNQEFFVWFSNSWKQLTNHTQLIFSNFYLFCHSNTPKKNYFQIAED